MPENRIMSHLYAFESLATQDFSAVFFLFKGIYIRMTKIDILSVTLNLKEWREKMKQRNFLNRSSYP